MPVITSNLLFTSNVIKLFSHLLFFSPWNIQPSSIFSLSFLVKYCSLCCKLNFAESSATFLHLQLNIFFSHVFMWALWRRVHWAVSSWKTVLVIYSALYFWCSTNFLWSKACFQTHSSVFTIKTTTKKPSLNLFTSSSYFLIFPFIIKILIKETSPLLLLPIRHFNCENQDSPFFQPHELLKILSKDYKWPLCPYSQ